MKQSVYSNFPVSVLLKIVVKTQKDATKVFLKERKLFRTV